MEKASVENIPRPSSIYSFLFQNRNDICEAKTVRDNLSNTENEQDAGTRLHALCKEITNSAPIKSTTHVYQNQLFDLKESTRKLLCLLDKLLTLEPRTVKVEESNEIPKHVTKPLHPHEGECSIYNRLTRKCQCLNGGAYNDFILLFNEDVKHTTCSIGEIIKNMRILKKFLYMGDGYTKHALMFLKEGLSYSSLMEKADIIQGCIHADICNVFEDYSIVTTFITWPCKFTNYGDQMTQILTAILVYKLAKSEDGKRYMNFNSKITYDIKQALKKRGSTLNSDTVEVLNTTLDLLQRHFAQHLSVSYYCKTNNKGVGINTLINMFKLGAQMPLEEALLNLELLSNWSKQDHGRLELRAYLPELLLLLKRILRNYNDSEINIAATKLLNNIVSKTMIKKDNVFGINNIVMVTSAATEPIEMKSEVVQIDMKKKIKRQKLSMRPGKRICRPRQQDVTYESQIMHKLKKVCDKTRQQIIYVPAQSKTNLLRSKNMFY